MRVTLHYSMLRKSQGPPSTVFDGALLLSISMARITLYGSVCAERTPCVTRRAVSEYLEPGKLPCYKGRPFTGYCPGTPSLRHGEVRSKGFHRSGQGAPGANSPTHTSFATGTASQAEGLNDATATYRCINCCHLICGKAAGRRRFWQSSRALSNVAAEWRM